MVWRVFVNFHWMEVHTSKLPMRDLPNTQHFQHVILESESILIQQTVSQEFHPQNRVKNSPSGMLARVNCPWIFGVLDGIFRKLPSLFCDVVLKIYDSWNTSGSWKHAHYGGSPLRSEQKNDNSEIVKWSLIVIFLFVVYFIVCFFHGWAGGAVNRVFLRKKMVYFLDWSGDEPESFDTHYTVFLFGIIVYIEVHHFVADVLLTMGIETWMCWLAETRDHKVENRTNWWAKLDNRERSNPPPNQPPP